jgi:multidrug efflux pump subunit AcrB
MLTLTVIVLGFFFLTRLPVDLLPSIVYPRIGVRVNTPGISPQVAVDEIARPLEEALSATDGVEQVFSQTREGQVSIDLYFRPGGNLDRALSDATAALNRAQGQLPSGIDPPRLFRIDPSQLPVYEFALTSPGLRGVDLRTFADEDLARELTIVPGVASVDVSGGVNEEVRVNVSLTRLQALGVGLQPVLDELRDRNQDVSGGRLRSADAESLTRTVGLFGSADELRNLSFDVDGENGPQRIYLRDVADIIDGAQEQEVFVNLNGQPAVKVSIQKQPDANTVDVVEAVQRRLDQLQASGLFPEDLVLTSTLDESRFIQNSISNVTMAGLTGAGLAAIAVLLFLGSLRQTLIIITAIPLAIFTAILLMGMFGLSINVFSLGGLALGVGIVVDNSIVMLENIVKSTSERAAQRRANGNGETEADLAYESNGNGHPGNGHSGNGHSAYNSPVPAEEMLVMAERSSQELESALVASTTTNLVSVMPFLLIGGFISLLFNELILTISFAVAASLAVSVTVVPSLTSRLLMVKWSSNVGEFWPLRQFRLRLEGLTRLYSQVLQRVLRHRIWVIGLAFLVVGGSSLLMVGTLPQEILPRINTGQARLNANFPPGTTLVENRTVMSAVDELLLEQPEVQYSFTTSGGGLFGSNTSVNALRGSSTITLQPGTNVAAFSDRMSRELDRLNLVGTRLRVSPEGVRGISVGNSPVRGGDIDLILQGSDQRVLEQAGREVLSVLDEQATQAQYRPDADEAQPELQILPNWERAAQVGLTAQEIGNTVQTALTGSVPTQLQRGDRLVDVRVQLAEGEIQRPSQLRQLPMFTQGNQLVRLGDVATIEDGEAPGQIQRINQRQVFIIAGSPADGVTTGEALEELDAIMDSVDLPDGVTVIDSASAETNRELQRSLILLGGLAAFLVFVVMAVQYNSLIDPLVIMLTVPLALAGGILGLFVTQTAIGATVIVGVVLLVGIVVNNAIILVERANQIREEVGLDHQSSVLQAASERLRPILMTTITTVLGMFPLALGIGEGSEFLQPLGVVVFSGLSLATGLTLFIIPCFYTLLHDPRWPQRFPGKTRKRVQPTPDVPAPLPSPRA